ncbi:hypothetical protein MNBD_UNCLBAC01-1235 [hydrothermal vent metagenome]|uniref:Uncharacterized protein n=1 Tax=hydrothermal vent metagenome TaxID=652676 RepID=A0A3B1DS38_9ZZZZ
MESESCGYKLFNKFNLRQGSYFKSSYFTDELRKFWINSYPKESNRSKNIKQSSALILITQDCDIACKDSTESSLEFLVCKAIKQKKVYIGNQFVNSVRKLHFSLEDIWYEANVDYIITVSKKAFLTALSNSGFKPQLNIPYDILESFKVWRTNRYSRTALPNNFNISLKPVIEEFIPKLTEISLDDSGKSFIRAIYVRLNSMDELDSYTFSFFALLRSDIQNETLSNIQDKMEVMCGKLSQESGYTDDSDVYAGRDNDTLVSYLTSYVRFNLDSHSLGNGDYELGPKDL